MTNVTRRKVAGLVPWGALAAVTIFAFAQMRARVAAEREDADTKDAGGVVEAQQPASGPVVSEAAARAAESALDAALIDLEEARAEVALRLRERDEALDRAEAAEADHGVSSARVAALEAAAAEAEERSKVLEKEVESLRAQAAMYEDPVLGWLEDASSDDATRQARACERAGAATPEQIEHLLALLADDGARASAAARLVGALPTGDETDRLAVSVLLDPAAGSDRVATVGPEPLQRPAVAEAVLRNGAPGLALEALGWLAAREPAFSDEDLLRLAAASRTRLKGFDEEECVLGARATGLLRLPGLEAHVLVLVKHESPRVRAAATHALSRVPHLDGVRKDAVGCLPTLLLDDALDVRTAAVLLAEALVEGAVDYDPAAGEAVRREAVQRILDQL